MMLWGMYICKCELGSGRNIIILIRINSIMQRADKVSRTGETNQFAE